MFSPWRCDGLAIATSTRLDVTGRQSERQAVPYQILPPCIMHRATLLSQRGNFPDTERQEHTRRSSTSLSLPLIIPCPSAPGFGVRHVSSLGCYPSGHVSPVFQPLRLIVEICIGAPANVRVPCEKLRVIFRFHETHTRTKHMYARNSDRRNAETHVERTVQLPRWTFD